VKLATEVLPLVPVTATMVSGCAPNHSAAARPAPGAVLGHDQRHRAGGSASAAMRGARGIGQDRPAPHAQRIGR
jgi:hypothetical protein